MKLGTIQEAWVKSLEEHPQRQMSEYLGKMNEDGTYRACCLGEALCVMCNLRGEAIPFSIDDGVLISGGEEEHELVREDYEALGLLNGCGMFIDFEIARGVGVVRSLAEMNDSGHFTWPQIAAFIRDNPEKVFTKSV